MADEIEIPDAFPAVGSVAGKRVVLTGASRGLGALLAHAFSNGGACVALVARTETDLKTVAASLPGRCLVLSGDVTDEAFNESVADAAVAEWGGVDVWICNAGISPVVGGPLDIGLSTWRRWSSCSSVSANWLSSSAGSRKSTSIRCWRRPSKSSRSTRALCFTNPV